MNTTTTHRHPHVRPSVSLLVMERGSDWPEAAPGGAHVVAIGQMREELHDELLGRARDRIRAIERHHERVRVATLSCNADISDEASERRAELARTLLNAVRRTGGDRLLLVAPLGASEDEQSALMELAASLCDGTDDTAPVVTTVFPMR